MLDGYYLIVYEKSNHDLVFRIRFTSIDTKINEYTSMNWRVIEIQRFYSNYGYFVTPDAYFHFSRDSINKYIKNVKRKEKVIDLLYNVFH